MEESNKLEEIPFRDIYKTYNDSNSFVVLGLLAGKSDKQEIEDGLKNMGFLSPNTKITKMFDISGNIKGRYGRHDVLFEVENAKFNPMVRLMTNDIKWTQDYIVNYKGDYFC